MTGTTRKVKISIRNFLHSGSFGPLGIGMLREEVRNILGKPDAFSVLSQGERLPTIWKYGVIEFHFDPHTDQIWLIHADGFTYHPLHAGSAIDLVPWWMTPNATLEQALEALSTDGIPVEPVDRLYDEYDIHLRVGSGVELYFEQQQPQSLWGFSYCLSYPRASS
jgi:hypothetical protein